MHSDLAWTSWQDYSQKLSTTPHYTICFKKTAIIPVPKKNHAICLNDYHSVALTCIIMKCFERLVMDHINSSLPDFLDPLQFIYGRNKSRANAISLMLHSSLEHLNNKDIYIRILLIEYNSTFNTIIPNKHTFKLWDL
eukprot:g45123.t1